MGAEFKEIVIFIMSVGMAILCEYLNKLTV